MAGSARYTAILDACVLYPATLRDLLLSLARDRLYHARWSDRIQDECVRSLLKRRPELEEAALRRTCALMAQAVPDSVAPFGVEAQHPDDFLLNQLDLNSIGALKSIKAMRARWRKPQLSALDLAAAIEKLQMPLVAARLREVAELI